MERKTASMVINAEHELESMDVLGNESPDAFAALVEPLSRIHRMDINMFNLSGRLIRSSSEDLYAKRVVSRQMSPEAYFALTRGRYKSYSATESIEGLEYKTAYAPIHVRNGRQLVPVAFLGLPYYSKQRQLRSSVNEIMNTLLNVYVILLLVAGFVSILVSGSITRGITQIGEKIREFTLGGKNEPLEWRKKDELGELIKAYNSMIAQLEESAERLAQNEREVAWREMAKQVAHEIKNPLTPMKLSIQYMMHAYHQNPDNVQPLLERVSSTLIEQIEHLSQIASEFSSFAKMPNPENQKIQLNQLVGNVFDLFKESNEVLLTLDMLEEPVYIFADKNQLISVLNNLIKNAIQAIPEERTGLVSMYLSAEDDTAVIRVQDNGTGIPEEMKEKVFVPNFTTKNSGTGLGLAICKNIIEIAGGRIYFETEVGVGTTFFVRLPILNDEALELPDFSQ